MPCPISATKNDSPAGPVLDRGYWRISHLLAVAAAVLVSVLGAGLLSSAVGWPVFMGGALLGALTLAGVADFLLYRVIITPLRESMERAARKSRTVIDLAPEAVFEIAPNGQILSANTEAAHLFGYRREALVGSPVEMLIPQRFRESHVSLRERYIAAPHLRPMDNGMELVAVKNSGEEFPVEISLSIIGEKEAALVVCVLRNVSMQRAAGNEIRKINELLNRSLAMQKALLGTLGHLAELSEMLQSCATVRETFPIVAKSCEHLFPGCSGAVYRATDSKTALERASEWGGRQTKPVVGLQECWALRRGKLHTSELSRCDGCGLESDLLREVETACVPMTAQGNMIGVLRLAGPRGATGLSQETLAPGAAVLTMVAERIGVALANLRLREELRNQATRDSLTGLFNRRFLEDCLETELLRTLRASRPLSVILLDVDHFKWFNDTFGHKSGDLVLRRIADILREQVRGGDIVCRFGGEELIVVCEETSSDQAMALAQRIRETVEGMTVIDDGRLLGTITISIGIASAPEDGLESAQLIHAADQALYRAKKAGRNRVVCATSDLSALSAGVSRQPTPAWPQGTCPP